MNHQLHLITPLLLAALLAAGCGADRTSQQEDREDLIRIDPKFHQLELSALERLRVANDAPDASAKQYGKMTEQQVVALFEKLAPGNTCTWGGFKRAQGGGDSCTPMRMTCDLPHAFAVGDTTTNIRLEVARADCGSPFLLSEVRLRATGKDASNLVTSLEEHFGVAPLVNREKHWADHVWAGRGEGLPSFVVMETKPR